MNLVSKDRLSFPANFVCFKISNHDKISTKGLLLVLMFVLSAISYLLPFITTSLIHRGSIAQMQA